MAKVKLGAIAGQVSGSIGTQTWSRNRYGAYVRNRSVPVNPNTPFQNQVRSYLSTASQAWHEEAYATQQAWKTWANNNPIIDRLGDQQTLAGNAAYIKLNARLLQQGDAMISLPPVGGPPAQLTTLTISADIGSGDFEIAYTPTPLGTGVRLWIWAAVVDSLGITYVKNLLKLVMISDAAAASPIDPLSNVEGRFGTLQAGQVIHWRVQTSDAFGLQSIGVPSVTPVIDTP